MHMMRTNLSLNVKGFFIIPGFGNSFNFRGFNTSLNLLVEKGKEK
jgi:hypothetical protein